MIVKYDKFTLWGISYWGTKRRQFYAFATTRESARDVYSKRRIIAFHKGKSDNLNVYRHIYTILRSRGFTMRTKTRRTDDAALTTTQVQRCQRNKANARAMIQAIDKRLKTRRIMRSLERFVGGRPYGGNFKEVVKVPVSSQSQKIHSTFSYPTTNIKNIMNLKVHDSRLSATPDTTYHLENGMSMSVQKSQVHKMAKFQDGVKRLCLVDDLKMLKITMSNTSSRNKLNPEINDHYNIFTRESQEYELKTKDKA
ncbi:hypothetical protein Tco_0768313 [Tanacetum coccineum]